ncbi:MAG: YraN family protein [Phycisphaerae bacterium]
MLKIWRKFLISNPARLGRWGEGYALRSLRKDGHSFIARNFRYRKYEIDLITRSKNGVIVFTEVKTRRSKGLRPVRSSVDREKQEFLRSAARHFLKQYNITGAPFRFDIITIVLPENGKPILKRYNGAF